MQRRRLLLLISKILLILAFLGFLITYAVKEYSVGYNHEKQSPVTPQLVAGVGVFLVVSTILLEGHSIWIETKFKRMLYVSAVLMLLCSVIAVVTYGLSSEFIAMVVVILWLLPNGYCLYLVIKKPEVKRLREEHGSSILSDELPNNFADAEETSIYDTSTHAGRCKCCVLWAYFLLLTLVCLIVAVNSTVEAYNVMKFEVKGKLVGVEVYPNSQPGGPEIKLRINCMGNANGKPTFLFQHGAGANGLAFEGIQLELSEKGRRSCTYDRPGYGRSEPGANNATARDDAERTISLLSRAGETGPYVLVGWSAGAEIIQVLNYYFSGNVTGMAFIDGYPNYRVLEAITNDLDSNYVTSAKSGLLGVLWVVKNLEPLGTGAIVGSTDKFFPEEIRDYYTAYYRNYYFWESQYQEIRNPNDKTEFLTKLGDDAGAPKPYPSAKINLNWPDITVPLLIMPANSTVSDTKNPQYLTQVQKYQTKATSATISILPGNHGIVYEQPTEIVTRLLATFT